MSPLSMGPFPFQWRAGLSMNKKVTSLQEFHWKLSKKIYLPKIYKLCGGQILYWGWNILYFEKRCVICTVSVSVCVLVSVSVCVRVSVSVSMCAGLRSRWLSWSAKPPLSCSWTWGRCGWWITIGDDDNDDHYHAGLNRLMIREQFLLTTVWY